MKLNADLGENESPSRTRALMRVIDLANVACGGHAGTPRTMERCGRLAREFGVALGAHPGFAAEFGRGAADVSADDLEELVVTQIQALIAISGPLHHVKLHGALYHATEKSAALARRYVATVRRHFPGLRIVALAGGRVLRLAGEDGLAEVFAERGYRADGTLIPRGEPGDLLHDPQEVVRRLPALRGDTICIHADSPNAVKIVRAVRRVFPVHRNLTRATPGG